MAVKSTSGTYKLPKKVTSIDCLVVGGGGSGGGQRGGGGGGAGTSGRSFAGGSGVVIIRYALPSKGVVFMIY